MTQAADERAKQQRLLRQLQRIDRFLKSNSRKFYQEYDTHNAILEKYRAQLKENAEQYKQLIGSNSDLASVAEIDAEDGVAGRLNQTTLVLARMANPYLFNGLIKKRLKLNQLNEISFRQIPLEVDAILFITNPLLVFDLLQDFLKFRKKQPHFIQLYITNRIARWLFRFTQFVMIYDQFDKIVQLTLLQQNRLTPYSQQIAEVVQILCDGAKESVLENETPVFLNDLRRLYMIFSKALFISSKKGQRLPAELKNCLHSLNPVLNLEPAVLKRDGMLQEFQQFHFASSQFREAFLNDYEELQRRDVQFAFEFLGMLHPTDRATVIEQLYQQSKSYVLQLFQKVREYYAVHGSGLPTIYKDVANTIREIVHFADVKRDATVDEALVEAVFFNESLYLGEIPDDIATVHLDDADLELVSQQDEDTEVFASKAKIFKLFQEDPNAAQNQSLIFELSRMPFIYLTVEYGKPHFNLFTFGEMMLMELDGKAVQDTIQYLYRTAQVNQEEREVISKYQPQVRKQVRNLVRKWKLHHDRVDLHDHRGNLQFFDFKHALNYIKDMFHIHFPEFQQRLHYLNFQLTLLREMDRWLAREHNVALEDIDPEHMFQLLRSDQANEIMEQQKRSPVGRQFTFELKDAQKSPELFKATLSETHTIREKLKSYERVRFDQSYAEQDQDGDTNQQENTSNNEVVLASQALKESIEFLGTHPEEKQAALMELARFPFRFLDYQFGKPHYQIFTYADAVAVNMDGKTRKQLLDFIFVTKQLEQEGLDTFKKQQIALTMFIKQMCQRLNWGKHRAQYASAQGKLDLAQLGHLLAVSDRVIRKQLKPLILYKDQVRMMLEGITELQRLVARNLNKPVAELAHKEVLNMLSNPKSALEAFNQIKTTAFGRRYQEHLTMDLQGLEKLRLQMINEYQLNVRLQKYYDMNT